MMDLRSSYDVLPWEEYNVGGKAFQILNWDKNSRYCPMCGVPTVQISPIAKKCPQCRQEIYPRISPAIIVLIRREDSILLVHARNFRGTFNGLVAGFLEPGETLEECVHREVLEETGLHIKNLKYFGSQPWPYPSGIMIGFTADYESGNQVGPGFFSSFRKGGVQLNMLGIGVILAGTVMTVLFSKLGGIPMSDMVGILCGATTNTPALGAAQQTLKQMGEPASGAALSCAVTYPLGVVGVILAMLLVRKLFVRPSDIDIHEHEDTNQTFIATFKVHNPAIFNKSIKEVALLSYPKFVISRLWREGTVSIHFRKNTERE